MKLRFFVFFLIYERFCRVALSILIDAMNVLDGEQGHYPWFEYPYCVIDIRNDCEVVEREFGPEIVVELDSMVGTIQRFIFDA